MTHGDTWTCCNEARGVADPVTAAHWFKGMTLVGEMDIRMGWWMRSFFIAPDSLPTTVGGADLVFCSLWCCEGRWAAPGCPKACRLSPRTLENQSQILSQLSSQGVELIFLPLSRDKRWSHVAGQSCSSSCSWWQGASQFASLPLRLHIAGFSALSNHYHLLDFACMFAFFSFNQKTFIYKISYLSSNENQETYKQLTKTSLIVFKPVYKTTGAAPDSQAGEMSLSAPFNCTKIHIYNPRRLCKQHCGIWFSCGSL